MIQRAFQHRSGRVISLSRFVLALVFFVSVWIDPRQPARDEMLGYPILFAYLAASAVFLAISWHNWWVDYRLARTVHVLDILTFVAAVYFTEGFTSNFTSPFFSFFAFLLLSATLRWGWRATALTAAAATGLYLVLGVAVQYGVPDFDPYRFGRRVVYLVVLSFVIIWFGINEHQAALTRQAGELEVAPGAQTPPVREALEYASARTGAKRAVFAWWEKEEPWIRVTELEGGELREQRFGPAELGGLLSGEAGEEPFLFDLPRRRALFLRGEGGNRLTAIPQPVDPAFAERFGMQQGLAVSIRSLGYGGELFLLDVPGMCCDDLKVARVIGREVAMALDRYTMLVMGEETAVSRARFAIARDLHDSVAQVLAGASFRLEALRSWIKAGKDADPEIVAMKEALRIEQKHVRSLIARLRLGKDSARPTDIGETLAELSNNLGRQWGLTFSFSAPQESLEAPAWLVHEIGQLLREAVANAARHGRARHASVGVSWDEGQIRLIITDDGAGLPVQGDNVRPWSIHERVRNLGGTLSLQSMEQGLRLEIKLPREDRE